MPFSGDDKAVAFRRHVPSSGRSLPDHEAVRSAFNPLQAIRSFGPRITALPALRQTAPPDDHRHLARQHLPPSTSRSGAQ